MLHDFIASHRGEIITRVRERMATRRVPLATAEELETGVPLFLAQLGHALERRATSTDGISASATQHANALLAHGFTVSQVVHGYGDVCQVVTGIAIERGKGIAAGDFQTLNLCLDEAIASAVTEFSRLREKSIKGAGTERIGFLAHELRNSLHAARLSFDILRAGTVPIGGSTGTILDRSLSRLQGLVDRSLAEVRLEAGVDRHVPVAVADLLEEIELSATAQAKVAGVHLQVHLGASRPTVLGDRHLLGSAIENLVQNALKFTPTNGRIAVTARVNGACVVIDVEDECGGLPAGDTERLFAPFEQGGQEGGGLGLGLAISRRAVRSMRGEIAVRDIPGKGCVFTIRLPLAH